VMTDFEVILVTIDLVDIYNRKEILFDNKATCMPFIKTDTDDLCRENVTSWLVLQK
jgi:hypothetical protein